MGVLVDQGKLAVGDTLGDIFPSEIDWMDVDQADDKKKVTLEEILTMTSGLVTACSAEGEDPQTTLQEVLNLVDSEVDQTGEWNYLAFSHNFPFVRCFAVGFRSCFLLGGPRA